MLDKIRPYAKFIAAIGGVVLTAIAQYALPIPDLALRIVQVLIAVAAAVGVYGIPNRPATDGKTGDGNTDQPTGA